MKRRTFLKATGYFFAAASLGGIAGAGCGDDDGRVPDGGDPAGTFRFPQGIASGDPRASSVVLWTRVERVDGGTGPVSVTAQVSESDTFDTLVVEEQLTVTADSDHTLRLIVTGLAPDTRYYYRFYAGLDGSAVGRTFTAPAADADQIMHLAWVSCQDYGAGTYGAYRQLLLDDEARPEAEQIRAVVHLGDFIYETIGGRFQVPLDDTFQPIDLVIDGEKREVSPFPSGGGTSGSYTYARTLDDYRHLYKTFLSDPDLQAARARWPFINTWDDHEFTNDAWQSQANFDDKDSLDEPSQTRKVNANQAWFEFVPANLSGAEGVTDVAPEAADFVPVSVEDVGWAATDVDDDNLVTEPNNLAAIGSMTIYRSFRFGKHMELVITDERSYRSDHAIPEEMTDNIIFFDSRMAMPAEMVNILDAGRTANDGNPPDKVLNNNFDNPRKDSPPGTMLGAAQKAWWKETMKRSDATWKIWGNEVPFMRFLVHNQPAGILITDRLMNPDAWDGYNTERRELMTYLRDENIANVVIITGDIHAHFAGLVMDDYDAAEPQPVAAELCAAGVSSNSLFSFFEDAVKTLPGTLRELITYDASENERFVNNLNVLLYHGTASAMAAADTNDLEQIEAARNTPNPHLKYADTDAQGYGLLTVGPSTVEATLVTITRPISASGAAGPGIRRTARFSIPKDEVASMAGPDFTGTPPFPWA